MAATHFIPPVSQPVPDERAADEQAADEPPTGAAVDIGHACECGHVEGAHEHYRRGTDCALCTCARYRNGERLRLRFRSE